MYSTLSLFSSSDIMLSVTLAARQQSRCLQMCLARTASSTSNTTQTSSSSRNVLPKSNLLVPRTSGLNSALVPTSSLSTSASRAMSGAGSDHVKMWTLEKVVSFAQIPAFIVPFMMTNPVTDAVFCTLLVLHSHWGELQLFF